VRKKNEQKVLSLGKIICAPQQQRISLQQSGRGQKREKEKKKRQQAAAAEAG